METPESANPSESSLYNRYAGYPRTQCLIPPQVVEQFQTGLWEVVGLNASYALV